jgi:prepilin-type processing-associated H-X9-DG protein
LQQDNPQWGDVQTFYDLGQGNDVWFNALPPYVVARPLYKWVVDPVGFSNVKSIFTCPTSVAQGINQADIPSSHGYMNAAARPLFNYAMNSKSLANESAGSLLRMAMVLHPSAFVVFSDIRDRSDDLPFYIVGSANQTDLATPHCYTTRFSARHGSGGDITFADGHVKFFSYNYVVADGVQNPSITGGHDPGRPDINWDCSGLIVP